MPRDIKDVDMEFIESILEPAVDRYFEARSVIFKHVGYVEDWRYLPINDSRDQFWSVDEFENTWVRFSAKRKALEFWLENDDWGQHGDEVYENSIYTNRHLPKWVYRGTKMTIVVADTHTDGNQYLQLFRNENEVKHDAT